MNQGHEYRALEAFVVDYNEGGVVEMLGFTWELIDFSEKEMTMQIYFDNPKFISANQQHHVFKLVFYDQRLF